MHPIQDKASQFSTLSTQDEWRGRSGQQKCKEDYSQGYRDIQRLARETAFYITCLSDWGSDIGWVNPIFISLWNGGCFAYWGGDSLTTGTKRSRVGRRWMGSSTIWTIEPHRRKEDKGYLSWPVVSKKEWWGLMIKKDSTQTVSRRRTSAQTDSPKSTRPYGKWSPNWEGPYVVKNAFSGTALILTKMDGKEFSSPINVDIIKKYYAWSNKKNDLPKLKVQKGDCGK